MLSRMCTLAFDRSSLCAPVLYTFHRQRRRERYGWRRCTAEAQDSFAGDLAGEFVLLAAVSSVGYNNWIEVSREYNMCLKVTPPFAVG